MSIDRREPSFFWTRYDRSGAVDQSTSPSRKRKRKESGRRTVNGAHGYRIPSGIQRNSRGQFFIREFFFFFPSPPVATVTGQYINQGSLL
jgi:hypothetical protein